MQAQFTTESTTAILEKIRDQVQAGTPEPAYRHHLAFAEEPRLPRDPHAFLLATVSTIPLAAPIARGTQQQIATFFASDGAEIIHPEPSRFFEVPISGPLPEDLNYIP